MKYDLKYLSVPLPEEIQRVKEFGDFASADIAIDFWLTKELPQALKERLIIEKDVIKICLLYTSDAADDSVLV